MAYEYTNSRGKKYYLHFTKTPKTTLYYFAGSIKPKTANSGPLDEIPAGKKVVESQKTGLPLLKNTASAGTTAVASQKTGPPPQTSTA